MKKTSFNATSLRAILVILLVLSIGVSGYGFYYAQNQLKGFSETVVESINQSKYGTTNADGLAAAEQALNRRASDIETADQFTSPASDYQSIAISDLGIYANKTNISIKDYSVINASEIGFSPTVIEGIEVKYLKITIDNPTTESNLIKFLKLIETNSPKMQVKSLNINKSSESRIDVDPLIIELYTEI